MHVHKTDKTEPTPGGRLLDQYRQSLDSYLASHDEAALRRANKIGQRALAEGLAISDLSEAHHHMIMATVFRVLRQEESTGAMKELGVLCASCPAAYAQQNGQARKADPLKGFFTQMVAAFEQSQTGLRRVNAALHRLHEIREEEAKRIAHALHDQSGQLLVSVHLAMEGIARDLEPRQAERLRQVRRLLDDVEEEVRQLSHELRPMVLDDLGLLAAIETLARGFLSRSGIHVCVKSQCRRRFPSLIETVLYRIVQIALDNVARHARATHAEIRLAREARWLHCAVRDNGIGFDVRDALSKNGKGSLGLIGIRERLEAVGGVLSIHSEPGEGTELTASVPLLKRPSKGRRKGLGPNVSTIADREGGGAPIEDPTRP